MEKKIVKICILLILLIILTSVGRFIWIFYDSIRIHISQIELNKISQQEKEELIKLNFLELAEYPSSLEFLQLRRESEIRETQYYIEFSIDKKEIELYEIEKNSNHSQNGITILKKYENNNKNIYELQTNFTQNSQGEKWSFLYDLIEKYKER